MMIKPFKYTNRDRKEITFTPIDDNTVVMSDYGSFIRTGFESNPDIISFIDPSGGPFIFVGMHMLDFSPELPGRLITAIKRNEDATYTITYNDTRG